MPSLAFHRRRLVFGCAQLPPPLRIGINIKHKSMKPECYRHYEAIGLGTVPITEMNPIFAWHLKGSVIYNNTNWEIDYLQDTLPKYKISANRNMIFEEYWIEYMEKEVKRGPLIWWDRHAHRRSPLDQFITNFTEPYVDDDTFGTDDESSDSSE